MVSETGRGIRRTDWIRCAAAVFAALVLAGPFASLHSAEPGRDLEAVVDDLRHSLPRDRDWSDHFLRMARFVLANRDQLNPLSIRLAGGFTGDEAGSRELSNLDLSAAISKGFCPDEFSFRAGSRFQYSNGELLESMTTLGLAFEHHFEPFLEGYVFVEGFSDKLLSIAQRLEIGTGFKLEAEIMHARRAVTRETDLYRESLRPGGEKGPTTYDRIADHLMDRNARLFLEMRLIRSAAEKVADDGDLPAVLKEIAAEMGEKKEMLIFATAMSGEPDGWTLEPELRDRIRASFSGIDWQAVIDRIVGDFSGRRRNHAPDDAAESRQDAKRILGEMVTARGEASKANLARRSDLDRMRTSGERLYHILRKKHALINLGLAFSVFYELEKSEISVEYEPLNTGTGLENIVKDFPLDASRRFRWVIRPSLTVRPSETLSLSGAYYLKNPLGERRVNGLLDVRRDLFLSLEFKLPSRLDWAKEIGVSFEYRYNHDNIPPRLDAEVVAANTPENFALVAGTDIAATTHHHFGMKILIVF